MGRRGEPPERHLLLLLRSGPQEAQLSPHYPLPRGAKIQGVRGVQLPPAESGPEAVAGPSWANADVCFSRGPEGYSATAGSGRA